MVHMFEKAHLPMIAESHQTVWYFNAHFIYLSCPCICCLYMYICISLPIFVFIRVHLRLLPDNQELSDYFIFQKNRRTAHCARKTVELLKSVTPNFIPPLCGHQTTRTEILWTTKYGASCKKRSTGRRSGMSEALDELTQCTIDQAVGEWRQRLRACARLPADNLNTNCDL